MKLVIATIATTALLLSPAPTPVSAATEQTVAVPAAGKWYVSRTKWKKVKRRVWCRKQTVSRRSVNGLRFGPFFNGYVAKLTLTTRFCQRRTKRGPVAKSIRVVRGSSDAEALVPWLQMRNPTYRKRRTKYRGYVSLRARYHVGFNSPISNGRTCITVVVLAGKKKYNVPVLYNRRCLPVRS